jgi:hypothetical protein
MAIATGGALIALGLLIPPHATALALRGPDTGLPLGLVGGFWLLKVLLLLHGVAVLLLHRALPRHPRATPTDWPLIPLVLVLGLGLCLRLPGLGRGLWYDEIQTLVEYVLQPWGMLLTTFDNTNQHLLFSVAARAVTGVFGASATTLRMPAVLFGVASLWAVIWFGRRWLPPRQAWWSAIILAVSYHHIWFSQNARGYTGLLLGTLVSTGLFLDLLRGEAASPRRVWGYAAVTALTVLTHVTALVVVAGHGITWLLRVRRLDRGPARWAPFVGMGLAGTIALACYAPVLPQLLDALGSSGTSAPGVEWQRPGWLVAEAMAGLVRGVPMGIIVVPVAGLVVLAGVIDAAVRERTALLLMAVPMAILAVLLLASGHNLWPRFFFFGAGFVVQWAVHGGFVVLERVVPRLATRIGDLGLGLAAIGSLVMLPRAWAPKQDYRAAAAWIEEHAAADDTIVGTEMVDLPANRWLGLDWPIVTTAEGLAGREAPQARTWVLYAFPIRVEATAPDLWQRLADEYTVAHVIPATIGGGEIVIVSRQPPEP